MLTYNHAPYIQQAIEGVLEQKTTFPFELVIGEDCSTDGTREIVFSYQKKYPDIICVVTSEKNVGLKKNGIRTGKACKGKYIAFCEGDDYWHNPEKLQMQVELLEANPDVSLVHSEHDQLYVKTNKRICCFQKYCGRPKIVAGDQDDFFVEIILYIYQIITCTACVRASLLHTLHRGDAVLYKSGRFYIGDLPCWGGLSRLGRIVHMKQSLATRRVLPESMSNTANLKKCVAFKRDCGDLQLYLCKKYKIPVEKAKRVRNAYILKCNCHAIVTGDRKTVEKLHEDPQFHFSWHQELLWIIGQYRCTRVLAKFALYFWLKYVVKRLQ